MSARPGRRAKKDDTLADKVTDKLSQVTTIMFAPHSDGAYAHTRGDEPDEGETFVELIQRVNYSATVNAALKTQDRKDKLLQQYRKCMQKVAEKNHAGGLMQAIKELEPIQVQSIVTADSDMLEYLDMMCEVLHDEHHEVRWRAAYKLGQAKSHLRRHHVEKLVERCDDDCWEVRCQSVAAIGAAGGRAADEHVDKIMSLLNDRHWLVRDAASTAAGEVTLAKLIPHVAKIADRAFIDQDSQVRDRLTNLLIDLQRYQKEARTKLALVAPMGDLDDPSSKDAPEALSGHQRRVEQMLQSEDVNARALACVAMCLMKPDDAKYQEMLKSVLNGKDDDPENPNLKWGKTDMTMMANRAGSESPNSRINALHEIGRKGAIECKNFLAFMAVSDHDPDVRKTSLRTLARFGLTGESCAPVFVTALRDANHKVRTTAKKALEVMGQFASVTLIQRLITLADADVFIRMQTMRGLSIVQTLPTEIRCAFLCEWLQMPSSRRCDCPLPIDHLAVAYLQEQVDHPYAIFVEQKADDEGVPQTAQARSDKRSNRSDASEKSLSQEEEWRIHMPNEPAVYVVFKSPPPAKRMWDWTRYFVGKRIEPHLIPEQQICAPRHLWDSLVSTLRSVRGDVWCVKRKVGVITVCGHGCGGMAATAMALMMNTKRLDVHDQFDLQCRELRCCTFGSPNFFANDRLFTVAKIKLARDKFTGFMRAFRFAEDPVPALLGPHFPELLAYYQAQSGWFTSSPELKKINAFAGDTTRRQQCEKFVGLLAESLLEAQLGEKTALLDKDPESEEPATVSFSENQHALTTYTTALMRRSAFHRTFSISMLFDKIARFDVVRWTFEAWQAYVKAKVLHHHGSQGGRSAPVSRAPSPSSSSESSRHHDTEMTISLGLDQSHGHGRK